MRKILMLMLLCVSTAVMAASVKVTANFKKGDFCVYQVTKTVTASTPMGATAPVTLNGEVRYEVTDVRPDGYTLEIKTQNWSTENATDNDFTTQLALVQSKMLEGSTSILKTDKDGKVIQIVNFEEIKAKAIATADEMLGKLLEGNENMLQGVTKDQLQSSVAAELTEDKIISSMGLGFLGFYGKTFSTGVMEDVVQQGMKFKTTYVVPVSNAQGYTIKSSSVTNMSKEDLKAMIIEQVEKMMPEQAEMVKQNIDMLMQSGTMTVDGTIQNTYNFLSTGWLSGSESVTKISAMGSETNTTEKVTIKECSWK